MNPRLVGLTGPAGCGKDTAALMLANEKGFVRVAFADPIKQALCVAFGWSIDNFLDRHWKECIIPELGFSPRKAMQTLGTEWGRSLNENIWINVARIKIRDALLRNKSVVVSDVRYENEADLIRQLGGTIIHIRREVMPVNCHSSENGVEFKRSDFFINNSDTLSSFNTHLNWTLGLES